MMRNRKHLNISLVTIAAFLIFMISVAALGQGAGRETPKPTSSKASPSRKPSTARSAPPAFRPTNPNIELVKIPAGSFMMGSNVGRGPEKPIHKVTLNSSFYMGKYEVTQTQWRAVMGNNPSKFKECANCPVERISWHDTQKFIQRLNEMNDGYRYRLPTEAEWEYACQAGTNRNYSEDYDDRAWYGMNAKGTTHPVGSKRPNAWGLADMQGNVWEWCEDWYHENYYGAPDDGSPWLNGGEQKHRVIRGGSWGYFGSWTQQFTDRWANKPNDRSDEQGFRVVGILRTQ